MASNVSECSDVVLRTERLVLRRFTEDDVDLLVELDADPAVMRWIPGGGPTTRAEIEHDYLPAFISYYDRYPGYGFWAVHERDGGEFLGWFHLRPGPDGPADEPELGFRLRRSAWGRGYATEGSRALVDTAFAQLGARRVVASTMAANTASRRVMEKAGLRLVRTVEQDWPDEIDGGDEHGGEHGVVEYALDRDAWEAQRPPRPLVGITAYGEHARYLVWDHDAVLLPQVYVQQIVDAGGAPVLLPPVEAAADAVDALDAVVLAGGPDVEAARYGAQAHPAADNPRTERDGAEIAVVRRALERGIPVLGVCRGAQLLNVALGGSLIQHLPDALGTRDHGPALGVFGHTTITLDPAGRVGETLGDTVDGLCHHHQAIDRLADGLMVTGRAGDGTIEAVELAGAGFVVGVQWHPEQDDPRLFGALVRAARSRRARSDDMTARERERA